jgi:hypothetical protein
MSPRRWKETAVADQTSQLLNLPSDLLAQILGLLDDSNKAQLATTSKQAYQAVLADWISLRVAVDNFEEHERLWKYKRQLAWMQMLPTTTRNALQILEIHSERDSSGEAQSSCF